VKIATTWTDGDALAGFFLAGLFLAAFVGALFVHLRLAACLALFLGLYAFVGNVFFLIPVTMAERLMYLPSIAWCGISGLIVVDMFAAPQRSRAWLMVGCVVLFSGYATRSFSRSMEWRSDITLFESAVKAVPESARVHYNLGIGLQKRGENVRAERHLKESDRLIPNDADVLNALGNLQWFKKDASGALQYFERSFRARRNSAALANLCRALVVNRRIDDALGHCRAAAKRHPNNAMVHHFLGLALAHSGRLQAAGQSLERALAIEPEHPLILRDLDRVKRRRNSTNSL
jgi:tetratricopeptide (TPR) repeat protein